MYHTVETKIEITANTYYAYKDRFANLSAGKSRFYEDPKSNERNKIWHYELLKYRGIHITLAYFTSNDFSRFFLILKINPKRILDNKDFISVTHESETEMLHMQMNEFLYDIGVFDVFQNFTMERIDYCCNSRLASEQYAAFQMELMKRSALLNGFKEVSKYCEVQHRCIDNANAIYALNQSIVINFYNKFQQMLDNPEKYRGDLGDYKGVIRFEIQCLKPKVRSMKYTNGLPDMRAFRWMKEEFSERTLLFYVNKIFPRGDYVTLSVAREAVNSTNYRRETKDMMLKVLEMTNEKRSLQKTLDTLLLEGIQHDYLNRILSKFDEINVNPVTIPIAWGIPHFDSPLKLVEREMYKLGEQYADTLYEI